MGVRGLVYRARSSLTHFQKCERDGLVGGCVCVCYGRCGIFTSIRAWSHPNMYSLHLLCVRWTQSAGNDHIGPSGFTLQDLITLFTSCGQNINFVYILQMSTYTAKE